MNKGRKANVNIAKREKFLDHGKQTPLFDTFCTTTESESLKMSHRTLNRSIGMRPLTSRRKLRFALRV